MFYFHTPCYVMLLFEITFLPPEMDGSVCDSGLLCMYSEVKRLGKEANFD